MARRLTPFQTASTLFLCVSTQATHAFDDTSAFQLADADFEAFLDLSIEELMEVPVTGSTMTKKSVLTAPSSVTVFNHAQIQALGVKNIIELMAYVPGFQHYQGTHMTMDKRYSVRGNSTSEGLPQTLLMVDGHRLNLALNGGTGLFIPLYPTEHIKRIEFIRGPGSAVYGSNAMLGVINIISQDAKNQVNLAHGNNDNTVGNMAVSHQWNELAFNANVSWDKSGGDDFTVLSNSNQAPLNTSDPYETLGIHSQLKWKESRLSFQHYQAHSNDYFMAQSTPANINSMDSEYYSFAFDQAFSWFEVQSKLQLQYSTNSFFARTQLQEAGTLQAISNPASTAPLLTELDPNNAHSYRAYWLNDLSLSKDSTLQFGSEYLFLNKPSYDFFSNYDIEALGSGNFPIDSFTSLESRTVIEQGSERDIFGLFGQYQTDINASTQLTIGLRYDHYASLDHNISPRLGLTHQLNSEHAFKLLYGQAFRAPTEEGVGLINNPIILGNPDLKPETVDTYEAIWNMHLKNTALNVTYFENHFDNAIALVELPNSFVQQHSNIDQSATKGLETELTQNWSETWHTRLNFTYLLENDRSNFREANHFGSLNIKYTQRKWLGSLTAEYVGKRKAQLPNAQSLETIDDYVLIHGKAAYQWTNQLASHITLRNLLNKDYRTPSTGDAIPQTIPNRSTEFMVGVSYSF